MNGLFEPDFRPLMAHFSVTEKPFLLIKMG